MHPEFYSTEVDAWKDIAEDMIEDLQQFLDGERELDDTDFSTDLYTAYCELYDDYTIIVTRGDHAGVLYETSVKELNA